MMIGTNAMYAYEASAGVFFDISTMATKDMDIRPKLIHVADKDMDNTGLLGIIKKADRSFESISPSGFRAVNRDGFMVDLIKSEPKQLLNKSTRKQGEWVVQMIWKPLKFVIFNDLFLLQNFFRLS